MMNELYNHFLNSSGVSTDTRTITKDCLFFALKGANFNGNDFAKQALQAGASFAVIDEQIDAHNNPKLILVEDVLSTLQDLAKHHREELKNTTFIGLTGSNGKTTSKELIHEVLSCHYNTYATKGNLNNHIGVPLSILEIKQDHEFAIIEMGANKPGDIKELCEIANPDYGMITNVGKAHLKGFGDFEGVKKTKTELYRFVAAKSGKIFINSADEDLMQLATGLDLIPFNGSNIIGRFISSNPFVQFSWTYQDYNSGSIQTQMIGDYNYVNMMAATAIGVHFKVPFEKISNAISNYIPENNRSQLINKDNKTIILDAYNANPTSMKAAIENFASMSDKKLCILGAMLELGEFCEHEHNGIVNLILDLKLEAIFVGNEFEHAAKSKNQKWYKSADDLILFLEMNTLPYQKILIKGSRSIKLESVVESIK